MDVGVNVKLDEPVPVRDCVVLSVWVWLPERDRVCVRLGVRVIDWLGECV